ncbi:FG-GAP repeat protein [Vitreoscilla filiformis]|uniref:FG-GAP repeat protein n=1 Tax=Vitreoscilla filiformis TaxID=63 RepID=A0A221KC50_VITFI|nr:FG-GAP-like repeat-containing protein [Vitreoscilla filiformis]ASM76614.1 FG-GAP repeat protein [Vitreoscilla filiformis]
MEKIIRGTDNADTLAGGAGNNTLQGLGGDDWLDGKAGADLLIGGLGNDTYVVGYLDGVQEAAGGGTDWVYAKVSHVLEDNAENLLLIGTARHGGGNAADNLLIGNGHNNQLNGHAGADTMRGGAGDDTYIVSQAQDRVIEWAGKGVDLVRAGVSYTLSDHVENLTLVGSNALNATGNAAANVLTGNAGANVLSGRGGADTLLGGAGNDTFNLIDSDLSALGASTGSATQIHGGTGWNTLRLGTSTGTALDLVAVVSATGSGTARLQNIQTVDLSGSGAQELALMSANVVAMGTANALNSGNAARLGWSEGTYSLQASEARVQVVIEGTAQDALVKSALDKGNEAWIQVGTLSHAGSTYNVYNDAGGTAQLIVNSEVQFELPVTQVTATVMLSSVAAGSGGFVINGQSAFDFSGSSVSSAGDVNGDGLDDLIVGAGGADPSGNSSAGQSYVVFGKSDGSVVDVSALTAGTSTAGFVINGQSADDLSGYSVSSAGDVNGDGLDDLIVGAYRASVSGNTQAGQSYVVFGKSDGGVVNVSALTAGTSTAGFVINGQSADDLSGYSVSSAGDVNGDGLDDLIVGALGADPSSNSYAGQSYVVFGKSDGGVVNVSALTAGTSTAGFVINGQSTHDYSGCSVSSAGDVNGDGLDDLIVGAYYADPSGNIHAGQSYVVFGKSDGSVVDVSALTAGTSTAGFVINGQSWDDSGRSVSSAGDVNGDGLDDLIVGASGPDAISLRHIGKSYVVFGKSDGGGVDVLALTAGTSTAGFVINGPLAVDYSGYSVSSAGDVNGDGLDDLIVGAQGADPSGNANAGKSYVVFGKSDGGAVDVLALTAGTSTAGFVINGQSADDYSGRSVSSAGDVNGDGFDDLIVGAYSADPSGNASAGKSYVIFGGSEVITEWIFDSADGDAIGTSAAETLTGTSGDNQLVAGAGDDTLIGSGGADVLYGGAGDDVIVLNTSNLSELGQTGDSQSILRIDGGSGVDTLRIDGAGITLDLTAVKAPVIQNIDVLDITGSGDNVLVMSLTDVLQLGAANTFSTAGKMQLMIQGNAGDSVTLNDAADWQATGTASYEGQTYQLYDRDGASAQLWVDADVSTNVVALP